MKSQIGLRRSQLPLPGSPSSRVPLVLWWDICPLHHLSFGLHTTQTLSSMHDAQGGALQTIVFEVIILSREEWHKRNTLLLRRPCCSLLCVEIGRSHVGLQATF